MNSTEPKNKIVTNIADIDGQICLHFRAYLIRVFSGRTVNRKRYGALRLVVNKLQKKYNHETWVGKSFTWPPGPEHNETPSEGYSSDIHNALIDGCLKDISSTKNWMDQDRIATTELITARELTLENVMYELTRIEAEKTEKGNFNPRHTKWFEWVIRRLDFVREFRSENSLTIDEFLCIYRSQGHELAAKGRPLNGTPVSQKKITGKEARPAIATAKSMFPSWPMFMSIEESIWLFSANWAVQFGTAFKYSAIEIKVRHSLVRMHLSFGEQEVETGQMAYISSFMFTLSTIFPFMLLLLLQTGWNFETLISIGRTLEDHIEEDLLDGDYVIIYGLKERTDTTQIHRSNKRDKFGAYQILIFVQSVMNKFEDSPHFRSGCLFQFVLSKNLWGKYHQVCSGIDASLFSYASSFFMERHGIKLNKKTKTQRLELRRLRTTYETRRREQGLDIDEISTDMGHRDIDTTIRYYDSDKGSTGIFNTRLRQLQAKHVDDLRFYSAKILADTSLIELRKATIAPESAKGRAARQGLASRLEANEDQVIRLISPGGQTYIASCMDSKNPDWPGAEKFVSNGANCNYFNRCPLCSKCVVFKESLPYLARRISDLDDLKVSINFIEWEKNYSDEYLALTSILDNWGDDEAVTYAYKVRDQNKYALPLTMRGG